MREKEKIPVSPGSLQEYYNQIPSPIKDSKDDLKSVMTLSPYRERTEVRTAYSTYRGPIVERYR